MNRETKEMIEAIVIILFMIIFVLGVVNLFRWSMSYDNERYCKLRFGENFNHTSSAFECHYFNETSGDVITKRYTAEQLELRCKTTGFFEVWKFTGECK